jgi:hypothetical protein
MLCWHFDAAGHGSLMSKDKLHSPVLNLKQGNTGILEQVNQLNPNNSFKTPGIHKTVSGNQTKQIKEMRKKSDACASGTLKVSVTNFEAWTGLFTIWCSQPNHPLAATLLTEKSHQTMQMKAINAPLSKCGFSRKTARSVVFGLPWHGELGWRCLFFEQGIQHMMTLIKHLRTPGPFHSLSQVSLG